jgi:hypothetical protein
MDFMIWLGNEIETIVVTNSDSFPRRKKLIDEAIMLLDALNNEDKETIAEDFREFHKTGRLGKYVVRRDIRDESDLAEEMIATLESFIT